MGTIKLGVNLDHVATLRQARYPGVRPEDFAEPDLETAIRAAERAGADSLTLHLRQDRRHIQDHDVTWAKSLDILPLNLEMGNTPEILERALEVVPAFVCLVPEHRREVTTEGGLDVRAEFAQLVPTVRALQKVGVQVSCFIDPEPDQVRAAAELEAEMVELHTGAFANGAPEGDLGELDRLIAAATLAHAQGLQVNAGHGIRMKNLERLLRVPHLAELNVGHHLISQGIFVGLERSIRDMKEQLTRAAR
ncbi:MAG: pyridoxine 5'-phosphate synthase [Verrucomicrobiota bacterium]